MKRWKTLMQAAPFMLPSIVGMIVFSLLPIVISIVVSLTDWNGLDKLNAQTLGERLCGLENYGAILRSVEFWNVLGHTVYYIVLYIPLVLVMSLFIASILNRNMRGIGVFRFLPHRQYRQKTARRLHSRDGLQLIFHLHIAHRIGT